MVDTVIQAAGLVIAITVAVAGLLASRNAEFRREQVSEWAFRCIAQLQTLALLVKPDSIKLPRSEVERRVQEIGVELSVLTEQGRLFFKNKASDGYGPKKLPAYRGVRPLILDELVIAHQLAMAWPSLTESDLSFAFETAVLELKRFVSLVQHEVGRERTVSVYTDAQGDGTTFRILLSSHLSGAEYRRIDIPAAPEQIGWKGKILRSLGIPNAPHPSPSPHARRP